MSRARENMSQRKMSKDAVSEIPYLIAQGKIDKQTITELLKKYKNNVEFVDELIQGYTEKIHHIKSKAKKLAKSIIRRSGQYDSLPLHILLKKAQKYKHKLGLNDMEMEEFNRILFSYLNNKTDVSTGLDATNTNIGRFFGTHDPLSRDPAIIKDSEYTYMNEIIKLYTISKPVHAAAVVQSITYEDCAPQALNGSYIKQSVNPACMINPVIAALFIPKFKIIERLMILANLAYIVKCRYEKLPIASLPDYFLFQSLISDPTDVVCDIDSPLKDLRNRIMVQESLWSSVIALRNGRYYDCISNQFSAAIDNCRVTNFDSPDLVYLGDESTVIRRLFQTFSFRPTIITTIPLFGFIASNPMNLPVNMNRVVSIPMITIRLPMAGLYNDKDPDTEEIDFMQSFKKPYKYFENNVMVPKLNHILYSKEVLIFHVPRRKQSLQWKKLIQPFNFTNLLPTISGFESANTRDVKVDTEVSIGTTKYKLRSVVCIEVSPLNPELIIGSTAIIIKPPNDTAGTVDQYLHYHPKLAALESGSDDTPPIHGMYGPGITDDIINKVFDKYAAKYGSIFIYRDPSEDANI